VADEVQVGFGRAGERFWGFELQGVVPDIVTLGKPIGNGYPIGAVVTTAAVAASFDTGMEYFNTFGGNPVACSAGLAVLDVLEEEGLQERALQLGRALQSGLQELQARHDCIGDVRGAGLFLGVELVDDPESQAPAPRAAAYLAEQMRDRHVLLSTDGPYANVLKIKPPMVLEMRDVNRMLTTFEDVLGHSYLSDSTYRAA
jgi:4-aminobutyrate aminotransferase-like enzyme